MTSPRHDNAASIQGVALRVTALDASGSPIVGSDWDVYLTGGFIRFAFTPQYTDGDEVEQKNAAGEVCTYFKMPDTLKNVSVSLELCDPDPILTAMLVGGVVLTETADGTYMPDGVTAGDPVATGYVAERSGIDPTPYGVAVEVWTNAIVGNRIAAGYSYWHYLVPYTKWRFDGERALENGRMATVFSGTGEGNEAFGSGPNMDVSDVEPAVTSASFSWPAPEYTDRAFGYVRGGRAPVGLKGVFDNLGVPLTGITAGTPGTLTPVNGNRPANLAALVARGALGNTSRWTVGQYVRLADTSEAYWNGTTWLAGRTPSGTPATGATTGTPGSFTPSGAVLPANLAAMAGIVATPTTAWTTGQRVVLGDGGTAHWTGTAWAAGVA